MQLYLPIADIPVNVFLILAMGAAVGFVSGMFGIGGGFLMTPLLIFVGITPAVAVASVASHIAASSFSGAISYWRRRAIDPILAAVLLSGGTIGTALGVWTFTLLRSLGQLDLMIATSYVILLTTVGSLMFWEGLRALLRARHGGPVTLRRPGSHVWIHGLPLTGPRPLRAWFQAFAGSGIRLAQGSASADRLPHLCITQFRGRRD